MGDKPKDAVRRVYPKAVAVKRQYGSLIGWVVYRNGPPADGEIGLGSGATATQAWEKAEYHMNQAKITPVAKPAP